MSEEDRRRFAEVGGWDQFRPRARCICSGDHTGESIDERPDCPVHGENAPPDFTVWDSEEAPF
jgi:hypothetical protein